MLPPSFANRKGVEVTVQHEPAAGGRSPDPCHEIDRRLLADHPAMVDAVVRSVEHGLDGLDHGRGVARRIGAVDAHQRPAQLHELPGPGPDARRETRIGAVRAQSRPRVAARSPRETVESVVERTNTPRAGAAMVSTSSP